MKIQHIVYITRKEGVSNNPCIIVQLLRVHKHLGYLDNFFQEETTSRIAYAKLPRNNKKKERVKSSSVDANEDKSMNGIKTIELSPSCSHFSIYLKITPINVKKGK